MDCEQYGGCPINLVNLTHASFVPDPGLDGPANWMIRDIIQNKDELWLATDGSGLGIFNLNTETFTTTKTKSTKPTH